MQHQEFSLPLQIPGSSQLVYLPAMKIKRVSCLRNVQYTENEDVDPLSQIVRQITGDSKSTWGVCQFFLLMQFTSQIHFCKYSLQEKRAKIFPLRIMSNCSKIEFGKISDIGLQSCPYPCTCEFLNHKNELFLYDRTEKGMNFATAEKKR